MRRLVRSTRWLHARPIAGLCAAALVTAGCQDAPDAGPTGVRPTRSLQEVVLTPSQITVTPATKTLSVGDHLQMFARVVDPSGAVLSRPKITWRTSDERVVRVQATTGLVLATGGGTASVYATVGGVTSSATITVLSPHVYVDLYDSGYPPPAGQPFTAWYAPAALTVKVGTIVTWRNHGSSPFGHTVASAPGGAPLYADFSLGLFYGGGSLSFQFVVPGTYTIKCLIDEPNSNSFDPNVEHGTIVVVP